ncbi:MAG: galactokinase [Spirochaetota bacterium]
MSDVRSLHQAEYGEQPTVVTSAPGVVNLMGSHTEATDGYLLVFGMDKRAHVAASSRSDGSMRFYAADLGERKRTSSSALKYRREDRFAGIVKGILSRLQTLGARVGGVNVTITSEVPSGIGLGASQAIGVALASALGLVFGFSLDPVEAAQVAYYVEHSFEGMPVGFATFLASSVTRRAHVLFLDTHRLDWSHVPVDLDGAAILGIDTHAPSALTIDEEALRQADCVHCLELLTGRSNGCSFQEFSLEEISTSIGTVPEGARHYCLHIVGENERVMSCLSALKHSDVARVGKLLTESHESLRDLYEGTSPEVDWLVKHAHSVEGVYGARLAGGSTGTCALIVGEADTDDRIADVLRDYERIFGFHPLVVRCRPDEGLRIDYREGT